MRIARLLQVAVVGLAVAAAVFPVPAWVADGVYGARVFPWLQWRLTGVTNLVPFAVLDVVLVAAVLWFVWGAVAVVRGGKGRRLATFWRWEWRYAVALAITYLAFLAAWGLNYQRLPLASGLDHASSRVTPESVRAFADVALAEVIRHRGALGDAPLRPEPRAAVARALEPAFHETARLLGVPGPVRPGVPKLTLLDAHYTRAGVSGMTDPLFLETLLASNLLPHELPVVLAHEWGHLAGFARESDASFFGWLVCLRGDARAKYSAWLPMLLRALAALDRDVRRDLASRLPRAVRDDLDAARVRDERDLVRLVTNVSQKTYDQYLKANRVQSGIRNYGEVLELVVGTRFEDGWIPSRR
jgi:hypothetical protein